jgi:two-component system alkaline phosphatase synthesis response regulator PhoP
VVISGHTELRDAVRAALQLIPAEVTLVADAAGANVVLEGAWPQLAIVDADQDNGDLLTVVLSGIGPEARTFVIALTRADDLAARLALLDRGADDVLVVPFAPEELGARARAALRRTSGGSLAPAPVARVGELEIDLLQARARLGRQQLNLTATESRLLYLLVVNTGRFVTRDEILDTIWGREYEAGSNVVDRHVRNLRVKLGDTARQPRFIATVPGQGYRFVAADSIEPRSATGLVRLPWARPDPLTMVAGRPSHVSAELVTAASRPEARIRQPSGRLQPLRPAWAPDL